MLKAPTFLVRGMLVRFLRSSPISTSATSTVNGLSFRERSLHRSLRMNNRVEFITYLCAFMSSLLCPMNMIYVGLRALPSSEFRALDEAENRKKELEGVFLTALIQLKIAHTKIQRVLSTGSNTELPEISGVGTAAPPPSERSMSRRA